jgi:hypothetical protein
MRWFLVWILVAGAAQADPVAQIETAAKAAFARMPDVVVVDRIAGQCGADAGVNDAVAYCTSRNQVLLAQSARDLPTTPYLLAHAYGHAVQVQHGVADVALRAIRNRPNDETLLRGLVERQVDCIAGAVTGLAQVDVPPLDGLFTSEPSTDVHWGRDPLRIGPQASIGLAARTEWFARGQSDGLAACAPGEFGADLLLRAFQG